MDRRTFLAFAATSAANYTAGTLTRADFARASLPSEFDAVVLAGFDVPGDHGAGALYVRGSSEGLMAVQARDGSWWNLQPGPAIWAGWFGMLGNGADETQALQMAIDYASKLKRNVTIHIASGRYKLGLTLGRVDVDVSDNGTHPSVAPIAPEATTYQARCLSLPKGVSLIGDGEVIFEGSYEYGAVGGDQPICIAYEGDGELRESHIHNIKFEKYFVAIGAFRKNALSNTRFMDIHFGSCAIGFYGRNLERCYFDRITARGTGCVFVVGGMWSTRRDIWSEAGGFADKCYFGTVDNIYGRLMGESENRIDKYFDDVFFKTRNNDERAGPQEAALSIVRRFPYRGICGRSVYIMARYSRPSNANVFVLVSHAYAPRAAVWIDNPIACSGSVVYLEGCGFRDGKSRSGEIGVDFSDPYLGDGVKIPAFVKGYEPIIVAQFVSADRLSIDLGEKKEFRYSSSIGRSSRWRQ